MQYRCDVEGPSPRSGRHDKCGGQSYLAMPPASSPPRYTLQWLVHNILPEEASGAAPESPAELSRAARFIDVYERNVYVATNDGHVLWYTLASTAPGSPAPWHLQRSARISRAGRPVDRVLALGSIGLVAVLCESTLTFLSLPALASTSLAPLKGAVQVVLDEAERISAAPQGELSFVGLCVLKRKSIALVMVDAHGWGTVKEVPISRSAVIAARYNDVVCVATPTEYAMVNLDTGAQIPLGVPITYTSEMPSAQMRPSIVPLPAHESENDPHANTFLITSHTDSMTLGALVRADGEPTGRLIEWPSHPRSIALEYPYLCALLRNNEVEVHDVRTLQKIQTITLPRSLDARLVMPVPANEHLLRSGPLGEERLASVYIDASGHTRTSFPAKSGASLGTVTEPASVPLGCAPVSVLLLSKSALCCLGQPTAPSVALQQAFDGAWDQAGDTLVNAWGQMLQHSAPEDDGRTPYWLTELRSASLFLGFRYLSDTRFSQAYPMLARGALDPRLLLAKFPRFRGLLTPAETSLPAMCAEAWDALPDSIDGIISDNLTFNYAPLSQDDEPLSKLQGQLHLRAAHMLESFLALCDVDEAGASAVHTAQLELALERNPEEPGTALEPFLSDCVPERIVPLLETKQRYALLSRVLLHSGQTEQALDLQCRLIDGASKDPVDTVELRDVIPLVQQLQSNRQLAKYGVWLAQHNLEYGMAQLNRLDFNSDFDVRGTLASLRSFDAAAADALLEHVVLSSSSPAPDLYAALVTSLMEHAQHAESAGTQPKDVAGTPDESYVVQLAELAGRLESAPLRARVKLILLLEYSSALDFSTIHEQLQAAPELAIERALVLSKLGRLDEALEILAVDLRDASAAEAFCSQGGRFFSPAVAEMLVRSAGIPAYLNVVHSHTAQPERAAREALLRQLLRIYMERSMRCVHKATFMKLTRSDDSFRPAATHLLSTQALQFDALQLLEIVPRDWPLADLETYLQRSLRRQLHEKRHAQIVKALAFAHNMDVTEKKWRVVRSLGGVLQDTDEDEDEQQAAESTVQPHEKELSVFDSPEKPDRTRVDTAQSHTKE